MDVLSVEIPQTKVVDLAPRALPTSDPQQAVEAFFVSEAEVGRKQPEWDKPRLAPDVDLVIALRKLEFAKKSLVTARKEAIQKRADLDKKWDALRVKEEEFRYMFITYNRFLKDNKAKREKSEKKLAMEMAKFNEAQRRIEKLKVKQAKINDLISTMEKYVHDYRLYEDFLEKFCNEYEEFTVVGDVLNRYQTLVAVREDLAVRQTEDLSAAEECRNELTKITEEHANEMISLNNSLALMQQRFDEARSETLRWEASMSRIKNVTAEMTTAQERVITACWSMYQLICKRKQMPIKLSPDDTEGQLNNIKHTILNLRQIQKAAKKDMNRALHGTPRKTVHITNSK